jgi:hypothetical protein
MVVPLVRDLPLGLRQRLLGLQRIVDDDDVGAAPGQDAADRAGEPATLGRPVQFGHRGALRREAPRSTGTSGASRSRSPQLEGAVRGDLRKSLSAVSLRGLGGDVIEDRAEVAKDYAAGSGPHQGSHGPSLRSGHPPADDDALPIYL